MDEEAMSSSQGAGEIDFVKVGAVSAFLLTATMVAGSIGLALLMGAEIPRSETREFLDDVKVGVSARHELVEGPVGFGPTTPGLKDPL